VPGFVYGHDVKLGKEGAGGRKNLCGNLQEQKIIFRKADEEVYL
jgi:hypothetical protein